GVFRIVLQQPGILLHGRAATGGVAHDGVELRAEHGVNVDAGLRARHLQEAAMQVQCAAATLTAWDMDLDAVLREHANRGAIQFCKRHTADAADEERHAPAASTFGGIDFAKLAEREIALDARRESVKLGHTHELEQSSPAGHALQARALIEAHQLRMSRKLAERRQHLAVEVRADLALQPRTPVVLDDLRTRALQQASVRHARWASGLAIQAAETAVNMGDERFGQCEPAFVHLHHLVNAPARRIHLRAQRAIGRTLVQAQPAVHTLGVQVPGRLLARGEIRYWLFRNWSCRA